MFLVLARHLPVLDGFDQHFQASVYFPLTSPFDKSQQHQNLTFGSTKSQTRGHWVRSKDATCELCSPRRNSCFSSLIPGRLMVWRSLPDQTSYRCRQCFGLWRRTNKLDKWLVEVRSTWWQVGQLQKSQFKGLSRTHEQLMKHPKRETSLKFLISFRWLHI